MDANELGDLLLEVLPPDGSTLGNLSARQALSKAAEREVGEEEYDQIRDKDCCSAPSKRGVVVVDPLPWVKASREAVATKHPQRQQEEADAAQQRLLNPNRPSRSVRN